MALLRSDFFADLADASRHAQFEPPPVPRNPDEVDWNRILPRLGERLAAASASARDNAQKALVTHVQLVPDSPLVKSISVFRALGFRRDEVAHTQALAWLLDPRQPHGFGDAILRCFLDALDCDSDANDALEEIRGSLEQRYRVAAEYRLSKTCRADVFIEGEMSDSHWCLVVEAKIDASERKGQLSELLSTPRHPLKLGVFLTVDGKSGTTADVDWARLSYLSWAGKLIAALPAVQDKPGGPFLRMYITGVLEDVCGIRCGETPADFLSRNSPFEIEQLLGTR